MARDPGRLLCVGKTFENLYKFDKVVMSDARGAAGETLACDSNDPRCHNRRVVLSGLCRALSRRLSRVLGGPPCLAMLRSPDIPLICDRFLFFAAVTMCASPRLPTRAAERASTEARKDDRDDDDDDHSYVIVTL